MFQGDFGRADHLCAVGYIQSLFHKVTAEYKGKIKIIMRRKRMQQSEKSSCHRYLLDHVTLKYQALHYSSDFRK